LRALSDIGYETPSPIQAETIPTLLDGRDLVGLAQTGTGKTAAFALPILQQLDLKRTEPQALVLAPTRELVIQVAEAFQRYATYLPGFHVLPIYGGQSYGPQLHGLRRGVHVVVGTPGRLIDHLGKRSLDLSGLRTLILDEADEMLRMGFIEDIQSILTSVPDRRQTALFSATMPGAIRKISRDYLRNPAEITVKNKTTTAALTRQRYWPVSGLHKLDALTRILEVEPFTAMIVFVRTKQATEELADKLRARGFDAAAINGDIPQPQRERTIGQLRDGTLDILVATDVAARGLDVQRISHVLNYDIPHDAEAYVHRIGRTGRAGRSGEAILFVAPRERHLVRAIEKATRQVITPMELPSVEDVNDQRIARFSQSITDTLANEDLAMFQGLIEEYEQSHNVPAVEIAAALARIVQGDRPLLLESGRPQAAPTGPPALYQVAVGRSHRVKPGSLVGAIANEGGLDSRQIGRIDIRTDHSLIELPEDLSADVLARLQQTKVAGHALRIRRADANSQVRTAPGKKPPSSTKKPRHKKSTAGSTHSRPGHRRG
jgi:ATP-dependent RNA helicase DeaD